MQIKTFEIRDRGTHIPAIAIRMTYDEPDQAYQLMRAGYGREGPPCILFGHLSGGTFHHDPNDWPDSARTMRIAHWYIEKEDWRTLKNGDVIDVRFIVGETHTPAVSEQFEGE